MCKKKAVYTMAELSMQMQTMYNKFNEHCFGGILPRAVISFEQGSRKKAYGWTYTKKMWKQGNEYKYSIVLASEYLDNLNNVMITLVHEMCHIYAMEKDIKDVSRGGKYHNDCFKLIAEQAGLVCTREPQGWATRSMTESLAKWVEDNCPISAIRLVWTGGRPKPEDRKGESGKPKPEGEEGESEKPKKKSGYYIYICPECKAKVRATKANLIIGCMGEDEKPHEQAKQMVIEN